jgi:hypothetical protein
MPTVGTANAIIAVRMILRNMVPPFACSLKTFKIIKTPRSPVCRRMNWIASPRRIGGQRSPHPPFAYALFRAGR